MSKQGFVKAKDASRRPLRGLYKRGSSLYARLAIVGKVRWVKLKAQTIDEAKAERQTLKKGGITPKAEKMTFSEFTERYLRLVEKVKRTRTIEGEKDQLRGCLLPFFGNKVLDEITTGDIEDFRAHRLGKVCANTVNHNTVVFRNILKKAKLLKVIHHNPFEGIIPLKVEVRPKSFLSIEKIKEATDWIRKNIRCGDMIADAILFLAFCGARWSEGMSTRWEDVNWQREYLCIGAQGDTKNGFFRYVDFHDDLRNHLLQMRVKTGVQNPTGFLFPSYRVPEVQNPWPLRDVRGALQRARKALTQQHWTPHDLRHHFASRCVMAGIDFKTIAEWLGHKDDGILVATVYGHLAHGHGRLQAAKLNQTNESHDGKVIHLGSRLVKRVIFELV